ncbi:hypothetical protein ACMYYO_04695 [Dermacoccaceae bacterium W4C1]
MTPRELAALLHQQLRHPVPVFADGSPRRWLARVDPSDPVVRALTEDHALTLGERGLHLELDEDQVIVALQQLDPQPPRLQTPAEVFGPDGPRPWVDAVAAVGEASARWASWRTAQDASAAVPRWGLPDSVLRGFGPDNPLTDVLRASARSATSPLRMPAQAPADALTVRLLEFDSVPDRGRPRAWALHLEAVAADYLAAVEVPERASAVTTDRTARQITEATRIVLHAGLRAAGLPAVEHF